MSRLLRPAAVIAMAFLVPAAAHAQNWSWDARAAGMGGVGGSGNLATKMIDEQRDYTSIVLPFGLFQLFSNLDRFDADKKAFDPIFIGEYVATPFHYVVGRPSDNAGQVAFVNDVRNATLSRDLTKYKGFVPANEFLAEGLESPNWGRTFRLHKDSRGGFQGIYVGAGPYFSEHSLSTISTDLTTVLATGVNKSNAAFPITESLEAQFALAITGGYRGRFSWPAGVGSGSPREGLYVAANFNYLRGFMYENDAMGISLLTDRNGLIVDASNILINRRHADHGTGAAVDMGIGAVIQRWELGFGAKGIANRINWTGMKRNTLSLNSLTSGNSNFVQSVSVATADTEITLPVDYRGNVAYYADGWSAAAEVGQGFGGTSFHTGVEKLFTRIELRGGARYTVKKWNPAGGVGLNLGPKFSIDVAAYGTHANIERKRQMAIAVSFRINHRRP